MKSADNSFDKHRLCRLPYLGDCILEKAVKVMLEENGQAGKEVAFDLCKEAIEAATQVLWESGMVQHPIDGPHQLVVEEMLQRYLAVFSHSKIDKSSDH